jgi:CBS domain-containing protein
MKAREVMTDTVHAFTADTPIGTAAEFLNSRGFTAAPVTDENGKLVGIVTATDLATADTTAKNQQKRRRPHRPAPARVRDLMTTPVESMTPGADVTQIVDMMLDKNIDWLPIVDGHTIVGVITPADLFRAANPPTG